MDSIPDLKLDESVVVIADNSKRTFRMNQVKINSKNVDKQKPERQSRDESVNMGSVSTSPKAEEAPKVNHFIRDKTLYKKVRVSMQAHNAPMQLSNNVREKTSLKQKVKLLKKRRKQQQEFEAQQKREQELAY